MSVLLIAGCTSSTTEVAAVKADSTAVDTATKKVVVDTAKVATVTVTPTATATVAPAKK